MHTMPYTVEFAATLKTAKIPAQDYLKIKAKVQLLAQSPRPRWAEKLRNRASYRIAVGDYRVLYAIDDDTKKVVIQAIGHRKDVYRA